MADDLGRTRSVRLARYEHRTADLVVGPEVRVQGEMTITDLPLGDDTSGVPDESPR